MNFFRSEEHLRRWEGYEEKKEGGKIALDSLMQLFGEPYFTNRGRPDYVSHFSEYIEVFYNRKRLHSALNYSTPFEYESLFVSH